MWVVDDALVTEVKVKVDVHVDVVEVTAQHSFTLLQVCPSPTHPGPQLQTNDPAVSSQNASSAQLCVSRAHSLMLLHRAPLYPG